MQKRMIYYHLPGLFEFYELYSVFLPIFYEHPEYFYDWCKIGSIYGAPADCLWGGGRIGFGEQNARSVFELMERYGISPRLTLSNSLLREEHLSDKRCNLLCEQLYSVKDVDRGIILCSDILLSYLRERYPELYFVSSTTKVLVTLEQLKQELSREEFQYVVPDFRLNRELLKPEALSMEQRGRVELLCNECCDFGCLNRKACYENVSRRNLGETCQEHVCQSPESFLGYRFSRAMRNPAFIGIEDIQSVYAPLGFQHFKIEGRGLGSAMILEFLLYYMTKPEFQLFIREEIYLDAMLDLL